MRRHSFRNHLVNERTFLKKLVYLLREENEGDSFTRERGQTSLDAQVDKYLTQFESEAATTDEESQQAQMEHVSYGRKRFLLEADDDDPFDLGGDAEEEEPEEGDDASEESDESEEESPPEKLGIESIDLNVFVNGVLRLIENYDSLLEVQNTILRRSINYIQKSYDTEVLEELKTILKDEHGMEPGKSSFDLDDEKFQPPSAQRAGAPGGGGGA